MSEESTLITVVPNAGLSRELTVGQTANDVARKYGFDDYKSRKAGSTLSAQRTDLQTFCTFLAGVGVQRTPDGLHSVPADWQFITFGLVEAFVRWMLIKGYAIASVNRKLSTIKVYAKLATKAGMLGDHEYAMIKMVEGYDQTEAKRIDERREITRLSSEKAEPTLIRLEDANALKDQPQTPQGRRDAVLMCLLLDHGLRASELASLRVKDIDLQERKFTVYRQKVDKTQTHRLTRHAYNTLANYMDAGDAPTGTETPLLRKSRKSGTLIDAGMNRTAISNRVRTLGEQIGIERLSAHDCRHYWATRAVAMGTDAFALRDAGGWSSLSMPSRYVEQAAIANEGVNL